jgi:Glycosyl transferase family 2
LLEEIQMPEARVTVAIPSYNRATLLKRSLESVLRQDHPDFHIVVLDNASPDHTEDVARSFDDSRVTYIRHETNIGGFRNFRYAMTMPRGAYLTVFQDDDEMCQGFLRESSLALDAHPGAAFSVARVRGVAADNSAVRLSEDPPPEGAINGLEYLHGVVSGRNWVIHSSAVMLRSSVLAGTGSYDCPHSKHTDDVNLYYRLAAKYDIAFINKELVAVGIHAGQETELNYRTNGGTGQLATMAERMDAVAHLLRSDRASDSAYREWLVDRFLDMNLRRSQLTADLVPTLNVPWSARLEIVKEEMADLVPRGESVIVADGWEWGADVVTERHPICFPEPADDDAAIREIETLRGSGAKMIVFGWPSFWWLDYYSGMRDYLNRNFRCVMKNSRLMAFELRS